MDQNAHGGVLTVTVNPAIDQTVIIPNFTVGSVNRVEGVQYAPGGKGVNAASHLADYGEKVTATGFLGRENSAIFELLFSAKEIEDEFVRIAGQTRTGVKISDPVKRETTDINFSGAPPHPADVATLLRRIDRTQAEWVVMAGSLPPGIAPDFYRDAIRRLKAKGRKVALDTSGEALRLGIEAGPDIIKPNVHELEEIAGETLGSPEAIVAAARKIVEGGVPLVIVSAGEAGAYFVTAREVVVAKPPAIEVKSTVGAGDAMVAGVIAGELRGLTLPTIARLATAFSITAISAESNSLTAKAKAKAIKVNRRRVVVERPPAKKWSPAV